MYLILALKMESEQEFLFSKLILLWTFEGKT